MLYFAKKSDVVKLSLIEEDNVILNTLSGEQLGMSGDYIATNLNNNQSILSKDEVEDLVRVNYWHIEDYHSLYENNAASMSELSQTEDESFVTNNTYEKVQERLIK